MRRYIDADKLMEFVDNTEDKMIDAYDIASFPTADVVPMDFHDRCMEIEIQKRMNMVEVVRCKDCKYNRGDHKCLNHDSIIKIPDDNDYCSYGER